jgi:hypothetical protein
MPTPIRQRNLFLNGKKRTVKKRAEAKKPLSIAEQVHSTHAVHPPSLNTSKAGTTGALRAIFLGLRPRPTEQPLPHPLDRGFYLPVNLPHTYTDITMKHYQQRLDALLEDIQIRAGLIKIKRATLINLFGIGR